MKTSLPKERGKACRGNRHVVWLRDFYEAIRARGEVPVTPASAARAMRILFAPYRGDGAPIPPRSPDPALHQRILKIKEKTKMKLPFQ
ncbi:MAG: hypothetical protein J6V07_01925, partial [Clostridia bacterium]|nr:hypothetical protein [Clostridia bacterium]